MATEETMERPTVNTVRRITRSGETCRGYWTAWDRKQCGREATHELLYVGGYAPICDEHAREAETKDACLILE